MGLFSSNLYCATVQAILQSVHIPAYIYYKAVYLSKIPFQSLMLQ